jgi:hypothetical protein
MPSFFSIHLAFKRKDFNIFENTFGKVFDYDWGDLIDTNFSNVNNDIIKIQQKVFEDVTGSSFIKINNSGRYVFNTPLGVRELIFGIKYFNHNEEDGYDNEQDLISIALSDRYFPSFIDWECEHGGTGNDGLLNITDKLSMIEALKEELIKFNPVFNHLQIYIKEDFA